MENETKTEEIQDTEAKTEETKKAKKAKEPKTEAKEETKEEPKTKEIYIPRSSNANDDPNLFVSVNGVNYLLPKGKKSTVPIAIAEEIERSIKAQEALDQHIDEMLAASK